jgi:hypothetical protein
MAATWQLQRSMTLVSGGSLLDVVHKVLVVSHGSDAKGVLVEAMDGDPDLVGVQLILGAVQDLRRMAWITWASRNASRREAWHAGVQRCTCVSAALTSSYANVCGNCLGSLPCCEPDPSRFCVRARLSASRPEGWVAAMADGRQSPQQKKLQLLQL